MTKLAYTTTALLLFLLILQPTAVLANSAIVGTIWKVIETLCSFAPTVCYTNGVPPPSPTAEPPSPSSPSAPPPPPGALCENPNPTTSTDSKFDFTFTFLDVPTSGTNGQDAFTRAATRWRKVIIGDMANVAFNPSTVSPSQCGPWPSPIDDLHICVTYKKIDGPSGVLGNAGPHLFRSSSGADAGLPASGEMNFDIADVNFNDFTDVVVRIIPLSLSLSLSLCFCFERTIHRYLTFVSLLRWRAHLQLHEMGHVVSQCRSCS
jgi:hypothetical protein